MPVLCQSEQPGQPVFIELRADDADPARVLRRAGAYLMFLRDHVKIDPFAVRAGHHTLRTEHASVCRIGFQRLQDAADLFFRIFMDRLTSPACKHLVRMVMPRVIVVVMMLMVMVVMMLMVVVMFMMMVVVMFMMMVVVMFMFMMVVMSAAGSLFMMVSAFRADDLIKEFFLQGFA